jgi:membrane protein required for beta-lactamase induction
MTPQVTHAIAAAERMVDTGRADQHDERWHQWIARGAAHDRAVHRRLLRVGVLIVVAAAIAASAWLSFGPGL